MLFVTHRPIWRPKVRLLARILRPKVVDNKDLMNMFVMEIKDELEARSEFKTGNKPRWLSRCPANAPHGSSHRQLCRGKWRPFRRN